MTVLRTALLEKMTKLNQRCLALASFKTFEPPFATLEPRQCMRGLFRFHLDILTQGGELKAEGEPQAGGELAQAGSSKPGELARARSSKPGARASSLLRASRGRALHGRGRRGLGALISSSIFTQRLIAHRRSRPYVALPWCFQREAAVQVAGINAPRDKASSPGQAGSPCRLRGRVFRCPRGPWRGLRAASVRHG